MEELRTFNNQAQEFLQSDNYRAYLEFDSARGSEQWNAFMQWQQSQQHNQMTDAEDQEEQAEDEERMQGLVEVQIDTVRAKPLAPMASNGLTPFRGNIIRDHSDSDDN